MRSLKIGIGGTIFVDGTLVDISRFENKEEFISSLLMLDVEIESGVSVSDLIHFFYHAKGVIKNVLSDEYEVVRALATTNVLPKKYKQ